jgi:uncharacterized tellurite resistance protein B-like protein
MSYSQQAKHMSLEHDKERLGQIKNLIMLAMADGRIDEDELAVIAMVAVREGMTADELDSVIDNIEKVEVELPRDIDTRKRYLQDMVELMVIDGEIHEDELNICQVYAIALGFNPDTVEQMVLDVIKQLD